MMDENNFFYKTNTIPNTTANSDDSYSGASFPWFPSQTKRKSRLGTHAKERNRVLKDVTPNLSKVIQLQMQVPAEVTPQIQIQDENLKPENYNSFPPEIIPKSNFEPQFSSFPVSPKPICLEITPSINNVKVVSESQQSNINLKSSLKKPVSSVIEIKPVLNDVVPQKKVVEASPRKEVRFAEPVPLQKSSSQKSTKELPTQIIVKDKIYKVWRELGKGGSSTVYEVFDPEQNDSLAIKRVLLPEDDESVAEGYLQEVEMLEKLQNCNVIIKMFDHELVHENGHQILYVVMEKGEIDLSKLMRSINKSEKLHYILFCWRQMLSIVGEIHDREIIHMDLKPANFLLVKGRLKLIDFGIASSMPGDKTSIYKDIFSGTLNYMSPEAISFVQSPAGPTGYRISRKSDVWSLGCILYSWIYGQLPFQTSKNKWKKLADIAALDKQAEFPERKDIPQPLLDSLKSCLEKDPKKRPSVRELLNLKLEISLNQ